jgi:hypothetical protein
MELTYKVLGGDGKEYGPASRSEITQWLQEGRITAETQLTRSDITHWAPAASFTELQATPAAAPSASPAAQPSAAAATATVGDPALLAQLKGGASWFYWIAGLSIINSIAALSGSGWGFIVGLGVTQIFDAIARDMAGGAKSVALVLDLLAGGIFILFGVFAHKRHTWSFVVGMILYALDGLLFLLVGDWLGLGFHGFVLFCLFRGLQACRRFNAA